MQKMKENKETIRSLRESSKNLRKELGFSRKTNRTVRKNSRLLRDTEADVDKREAQLERHLTMLRKNLDTIKAKVSEKQCELNRCRDQALDLERAESRKAAAHGSESFEQIRGLESQLDKALVRHNEAQNIKITYTQIIKRLEKERVTYDNKLSAIQRTLKAKEQDCKELTLLEFDACRAKDAAVKDKQNAVQALEEGRSKRKSLLQEKRALRQAVAGMVSSAERMVEARRRLVEEDEEEEQPAVSPGLQNAVLGNTFGVSKSKEEEEAMKLAIDEYEHAFEKIRIATGISSIMEVLDKFYSQTNTRENLEAISEENEEKIESKSETIFALRNKVESARYTGLAARGTDRKSFDEIEEWLTKAEMRLTTAKENAEDMDKLLVSVQGGVNHLLEKLANVAKVEDPRKYVHVQADTLEILVAKCGDILMSLLADVERGGMDEARVLALPTEQSLPEGSRPYNNRISLDLFENYITEQVNEFQGGRERREPMLDHTGESEERDKDIVMTRANIKKASSILTNSHMKRKTTIGGTSTTGAAGRRRRKTITKGKSKPGDKRLTK